MPYVETHLCLLIGCFTITCLCLNVSSGDLRSPAKRSVNIVHAGINKRSVNVVYAAVNTDRGAGHHYGFKAQADGYASQ
jgi:hypothetical protein